MYTCRVVLMSNNFLSSIENSLLAVSVWPGKLNYPCVRSHAVRACQPNCVPRDSNYTCAVCQWHLRLQTDSSGSDTSLRLTRAILKNNLLVRRLASPDEGSSSRRILRPTPAIAPRVGHRGLSDRLTLTRWRNAIFRMARATNWSSGRLKLAMSGVFLRSARLQGRA